MAVTYSTPQLISAGSNTATANVTGLAGGKRLLVAIGARAASVAAPTTLTVGGVTATIVNVGGTDATFDFTGGRYLSLYQISAGSAPGSGTQSCTITWTSADRVTMWVTEVTGDDGSGVDIAIGATNGTSHTVSGLDSTATGQSLFSVCERGGTGTYAWTTSSTDEIAEGGASGCSLGIGRLTLGSAGSYSSQWTATGGTGQIAVIGIIIAEAASGLTLALTGASITGTAATGTMTSSRSKALTGSALTGTLAAGTLAPSTTKALAGSSLGAALTAGTMSPSLTLGLSGAALGAALAAGTLVYSVPGAGDVTLALTGAGIAAALAAGTMTSSRSLVLSGAAGAAAAAAGSVSPSLTVAQGGAALAASLAAGTLAPGISRALTTAALTGTAAAGTMAPSTSRALTSATLTLTLAAGTMTSSGGTALDPIPHLTATWAPGLALTATHAPGLRLTATWSSTQ